MDGSIAAIAAPQAASGALAIVLLPLILASSGGLSLWEWAIVSWACSQFLLALLPRWGLAKAWLKAIDLLSLTAIVTLVATLTGGLYSFAMAWLLVVPAHASLSRDRTQIVSGIAMSAGALIVLTAATLSGFIPAEATQSGSLAWLFGLSTGLAVTYSGILLLSGARQSARAQERVERDEEYYRSLSENSRDMFLRFGPDGALNGVSQACRDILGYRRSQLLQEPFAEFIHRADRKNVEISLAQASYFGSDTTIVFRMRHSQGHYVWLEMRCRANPVEDSPLKGSATEEDQAEPTSTGNPEGYEVIGVARDISELKQHQEGLQRARDEAETASQSKSQFLANISHELRTPLNAIIGFSDMMRQETFGPVGDDHYRDYARIINDSGAHLLDLINDLLDMSKIEAGKFTLKMERLFFPTVIENCLKLIRLQAEQAKVKFTVDLPASMPHIKADPRACRQILINLLSNAIKFTPPGGTISIRAHVVADNLQIEVGDTGVGIPPQTLARLGERFEQAGGSHGLDDQNDRTLAGTGLGLSLVRSLAELHGGEMHIRSRMGEGTEVTVSIPTRKAELHHQEKQADLPLDRASVIERHMARLEEVEAAQNGAAQEPAVHQEDVAQEAAETEDRAVKWPPLRGAA